MGFGSNSIHLSGTLGLPLVVVEVEVAVEAVEVQLVAVVVLEVGGSFHEGGG